VITKTEDGMEFPSEAYAYAPDPQTPAGWKLRLWETPEKKVTAAQLGRAAAAFSPGGFRGNKVEIPTADVARVKARIRAEYKKLGVKENDVPDALQASDGPQFVAVLGEIGEGLVRIPLAKVGTWWKGKLKFSITRQDLTTVVSNFRKRKTGEVVIDYDHSTEFSAGSGEPVPAAGWLKSIDDAPDAGGVLWGEAEFTDRARAMLRAHEYKYVSPVINWGARDKATGEQQGATVTSVALTNQPVLEEMPAIALSDGWAAEPETPARIKEESIMAVKKVVLADRAAGKVRVILEDDSETMLSVEGFPAEPKVIRLSDVKRTNDGRYDFASLAPGDETLIASDVLHGMQVQAELDAATQAGKITPAQRPHFEKLALSDLAAFRELVGTMHQVDLSEHGLAGSGEEAGQDPGDRLDTLTKAKMAANKGLAYSEALKLVASEHPDLGRAWHQSRRLRQKEGN
jgi:phage I-like protein